MKWHIRGALRGLLLAGVPFNPSHAQDFIQECRDFQAATPKAQEYPGARGLQLSNRRVLDSMQFPFRERDGISNPRWSPDGRSILYSANINVAFGPRGAQWRTTEELRIVRHATGRKVVLIPDARYGEWSRDGTQIAYLTAGRLAIFDVETGKRTILPIRPSFRGSAKPHWSDDGSEIHIGSYRVSLDDLSFAELPRETRHKLDSLDSRSTAHVPSEGLLITVTASPSGLMGVSLRQDEPLVTIYTPRLLWAVSTDYSYAKPLAEHIYQLAVSPDGTKLAWVEKLFVEGVRGPGSDNLVVADLTRSTAEEKPFRIDITNRIGAVAGDLLRVFPALVNPLNNKVTGYKLDEEEIRAVVVVTEVTGNGAVVQPVIDFWGTIEVGDVAAWSLSTDNFWSQRRDPSSDPWTQLQPAAPGDTIRARPPRYIPTILEDYRRSMRALDMISSNPTNQVAQLIEFFTEGRGNQVRASAAEALGRLRAPEAATPLLANLDSEGKPMYYIHETVPRIVWALGQIGDTAALRPLTEFYRDHIMDRHVAPRTETLFRTVLMSLACKDSPRPTR